MSRKSQAPPPTPLLPGFTPLASLWEGDNPLYPSEQSALWAVRTMRTQLADAGAIALLRGRTVVHVERLKQVVERDAIERMRRRCATTS